MRKLTDFRLQLGFTPDTSRCVGLFILLRGFNFSIFRRRDELRVGLCQKIKDFDELREFGIAPRIGVALNCENFLIGKLVVTLREFERVRLENWRFDVGRWIAHQNQFARRVFRVAVKPDFYIFALLQRSGGVFVGRVERRAKCLEGKTQLLASQSVGTIQVIFLMLERSFSEFGVFFVAFFPLFVILTVVPKLDLPSRVLFFDPTQIAGIIGFERISEDADAEFDFAFAREIN